jgi:phosphoribosylformimino-5-aminoimidazole carboxamide ribotide isomerase
MIGQEIDKLKHIGQLQIIPAIDLKGGRCVRLSQGQKDSSTVYSDDPLAVAQEFAVAGAQTIHVVDLDGAFNGSESANWSVLKQILATVDVPIEFGGGIRSSFDVQELIAAGVSRVVLGTLATESSETLQELIGRFGSHICVGIDARDGIVRSHGWQADTKISALEFAVAVANLGVDRIIYTDIKRDGMLTGPNIEETVALARATSVRVTASGGVSSLNDIRRLRNSGEPLVDSVIVGRALYERKFTLEEALQVAS